ncbi:hypothetical protein DID88_004274 [Monilinia fructigena]|uniref:Uncharacterized protein n=1 Tax=Monilinia fructigena TaxID=38457 RepID=A0A395ISA1_9HELO|nr:hypothetical protein DID88_004274 [Monilinia fructigena]
MVAGNWGFVRPIVRRRALVRRQRARRWSFLGLDGVGLVVEEVREDAAEGAEDDVEEAEGGGVAAAAGFAEGGEVVR